MVLYAFSHGLTLLCRALRKQTIGTRATLTRRVRFVPSRPESGKDVQEKNRARLKRVKRCAAQSRKASADYRQSAPLRPLDPAKLGLSIQVQRSS